MKYSISVASNLEFAEPEVAALRSPVSVREEGEQKENPGY